MDSTAIIGMGRALKNHSPMESNSRKVGKKLFVLTQDSLAESPKQSLSTVPTTIPQYPER